MTRQKESAIRSVNEIEKIILSDEELILFVKLKCKITEDQETTINKITNWLKNKTSREGFKYLLVPEYRIGSREMILNGIINNKVKLVRTEEYKIKGYYKTFTTNKINKMLKDKKIKEEDIEGEKSYILGWNFGESEAYILEKTSENIENYITNFIKKTYANNEKMIFGKRYWSSRDIRKNNTL